MPTESSGAGPTAGTLAKAVKPKKARKKAPTKQGQEVSLDIQAQVWAHIIQRPDDTDSYIAEALGLNSKTVGRIRKKMPPGLSAVVINKPTNISQRLTEHLTNTMDALDRVNEVTKDQEWLLRQNATELGSFYGSVADRAIRLLEAAARAQRPQLVAATEEGY